MPASDKGIWIDDKAEPADLSVMIMYHDPDELGDGVITIASPHFDGLISKTFTTPKGMKNWLHSEYAKLVQHSLQVRGARPLNAKAPQDFETQRRYTLKMVEGFGADLYREYVPKEFKEVFWELKKAGKLHSIQITSNNPSLPWELVFPINENDGTEDGFLGINYRLARWTTRNSEEVRHTDKPLDHIAFTGIATVAPVYDGRHTLPFQQVEVDALSKLAGFRLVGGRLWLVREAAARGIQRLHTLLRTWRGE